MKYLVIFFILLSSFCSAYSPDFLEYIKQSENGIKKGWTNNKWYPHDVLGVPHIAYGHKIKKNEDFSKGISEEKAIELLLNDLDEARSQSENFLRQEYNVDFASLTQYQQEIFIDFQFNGVLIYFPKFINAVLRRDVAGMRAEYKRFAKSNGEKIELKDRNSRFEQRYLKGS